MDAADAPHDSAERTAWLLAAIAAAPAGGLRLPSPPGEPLQLQGVRLNVAGGVNLRLAALQGVNLSHADLTGADLTGADLSGATMRSATLRGARLEGASFVDADLSGCDFTGAQASEAQFGAALLEDARFPQAILRFAVFSGALLDGADFAGADLWSARMDGAEAPDAKLRGAVLQEANLAGAILSNADLGGAELKKADLRGATLSGADLRGATLSLANLAGADLSGASLPRVDLTTCTLQHVRLAGAWLESTRFRIDQLGGALGEETAGAFDAARQAYLSLEQNFRGLGSPEAASWSYRRARHMGQQSAWLALRVAFRGRDWRHWPARFLAWAGDAFAEWLCDYGESLPRVLRAYLVTLVSFAACYGLTGSLVYTAEGGANLIGQPVYGVFELLGFSFLNMSISGIPDVGLKPRFHVVYFVSSLQYVLGVVLIGLFGYILGNRLRR